MAPALSSAGHAPSHIGTPQPQRELQPRRYRSTGSCAKILSRSGPAQLGLALQRPQESEGRAKPPRYTTRTTGLASKVRARARCTKEPRADTPNSWGKSEEQSK